MPTPREQNIARATNLSSNMDELMDEVLLALTVEANARGKGIPGGAKGSESEWHLIPWRQRCPTDPAPSTVKK